MKAKNWQKFPVLFSLYIAQSIPMSFFSTVVPVIMRQEKYSLESIGLLQLVKLPWIFKFLWAPIIDNNTRSKKQIRNWIILSEIFYAFVIISIGFFNLQTDFKLIVALMVVAFIASATQDIATDIFAILVLKKKERSFGNSIQSGGSFIGSLFGTGVLLIAYYYFGWKILLMLLAAFVIFAIFPLIIYRKDMDIQKEKNKSISIKEIFTLFSSQSNRKHLLILIFYYSGIIGILAMLKPYLVDLGYNIKEIGFMSGIVGTSVAAGSTFVAGYLIRLFGQKRCFFAFAFTNLLAGIYFLYLSGTSPSLAEIYTGICLIWGAYGLSTVIIYTSSMGIVRKGKEGSDFTIQIVITHLSSMIIAIGSGKIGDALGYSGIYGVETALCCLTIILLFYVFNLKKTGK